VQDNLLRAVTEWPDLHKTKAPWSELERGELTPPCFLLGPVPGRNGLPTALPSDAGIQPLPIERLDIWQSLDSASAGTERVWRVCASSSQFLRGNERGDANCPCLGHAFLTGRK